MKSKTPDTIKQMLINGKSITQRQAIKMFNCYRLASIIKRLRSSGMFIKTDMIREGNAIHAKYSLLK